MPDSESPALTIHLLGTLEVHIDGCPLPAVRSQKVKWLLALLTLQHGREVRRSWLAERLWPEADPDKALNSLSQCLTSLTRALGTASARIERPDKHTLRLNLTGVDVDLLAFERLLRNGDVPSLGAAVVVYRGPLLAGCPEPWAEAERQERQVLYQQALARLAAHHRAGGDFQAAIRYLRLALKDDPWNEAARRDLMQTLAQTGDREEALNVYRDWFRFLQRQQPDLLPHELTRALYDTLRSSSSSAYRLAHPEASPHHVAAAPPPRGFLPVPLTDLVGNEAILEWVRAGLYRDRLVTLTGPGGIGKTRLALAAAHGAGEAFLDGAWFVDLSPLSEPGRIANTIVSALQLVEAPGGSALQILVSFLRRRHLLLVLDNCEHVLEGCRALAADLLSACPHLCILATSRQALRLTGEVCHRVPALEVPPIRSSLETDKNLAAELLEYSGVRLFVDRARAVYPTFAVTATNGLMVADICRHLEGIPLALELAAARMRALSLEEMANRLADRFALLRGGDPSRPPRYQAMRATLDWSYGLLSGAERRLLSRLSVFAGGWTLAAAEAMGIGTEIESWQVLDLLTALVDKSLVIYESGEGGGRYRLLETVREYAAERLAGFEETQVVRQRHLNYFLSFAERAEPELRGRQQLDWLCRMDAERDNIRAALALSLEEERSWQAGLHLSGMLAWFWYRRGYLSEGARWLEQFLERTEARGETPERARALVGAGIIRYYQLDRSTSLRLSGEATRIYRSIGSLRGIADSLIYQSVSAALVDAANVEAMISECIALWRELGDPWKLALALWAQGAVLMGQERNEEATAPLNESRAIFDEIGDAWGIGAPLRLLGAIAVNRGDTDVACRLLSEAVEAARKAMDPWRLAYFCECLGHVLCDQRRFEEAVEVYSQSLELREQLGVQHNLFTANIYLGRVWRSLGQWEQSRRSYGSALKYSRNLDVPFSAAVYDRRHIIGTAVSNAEANDWLIAEAEAAFRTPTGS